MKTIEVIVDTEGNAFVQTKGFSGPSCREASNFLEKALGQRLSEQLASEFHQAAATAANHCQQQG